MNTKYLLLILSLLVITSCNDGFLERIPQDQLSDESYWKVEDDVIKYTTSLYRYIPEPANYVILTDAYTDNAIPVHIFTNQGAISSGTATASTGHFQEVWSKLYQGIRRCNIFFENIDKVDMTEENRNIFIGEVEFMRAFFHASLLKYYGGVPILTHSLALNEPIPARDSAEDVYKFVIDECNKAIEKLPIERDDLGRATKGAAIALKAHISFLMKDYELTISSVEELKSLNKYSLHPDYEQLFSAEYENNKEVIFDIQFMDQSKDYVNGSWIDQYFAPGMMGGWEGLSPSQDLIDEYECLDGKSIKESPLYDESSPYENRDPRLGYTILWHGCNFAGQVYNTEGVMGNGNATRTGYTIKKYIDPTNLGCQFPGRINFIVYRYAEMLLDYAYAVNEISGPTEIVYEHVNMIRERVGLPNLHNGLNKEEMRNAIRHERRVEFAFEGIHMFETNSWRTTEACVEKPVYGMNSKGEKVWIETREFDPEKQYLWAIPLNEIDLSKGTLVQNPGY